MASLLGYKESAENTCIPFCAAEGDAASKQPVPALFISLHSGFLNFGGNYKRKGKVLRGHPRIPTEKRQGVLRVRAIDNLRYRAVNFGTMFLVVPIGEPRLPWKLRRPQVAVAEREHPMNLETIYTVCAVAGGTILVLRLVLMLIGLDQGDSAGDSVIDHSIDDMGDHGAGHSGAFTFLSLQSIAGFFTMFGLVGLGLLRIQVSDWLSLLGGMAAGALTAWATGMIFLSMRRLQSEGTLDIRNAIGQAGTVYLTIPAEGTGVVNVTVQGTLRTMDAVSENGKPIATGKIVQVVGISAGKILVVREQTADNR